MTSRHGRRSRIAFGLLLIALGIVVGILAYVVGRADDHAHRLQPMDTYRGKPIFYGLGNFV